MHDLVCSLATGAACALAACCVRAVLTHRQFKQEDKVQHRKWEAERAEFWEKWDRMTEHDFRKQREETLQGHLLKAEAGNAATASTEMLTAVQRMNNPTR